MQTRKTATKFTRQTIRMCKKVLRRVVRFFSKGPLREKLPYASAPSSLHRQAKDILYYIYSLKRGGGGRYKGFKGFHILRAERGTLGRGSFNAMADPAKIILISPQEIVHKLTYDLDIYFGDIIGGDWDLERRADFETSPKHRSIYERFVLDLPWGETELSDVFVARLTSGKRISGHEIVSRLGRYHDQVEALFASMKRDGFIIPRDKFGRPVRLPHVHIGRHGEYLFGNNGNHRLAIAKVLGLKHIPCWVRGRHALWQQVRQETFDAISNPASRSIPPSFETHQDLADLIGSSHPVDWKAAIIGQEQSVVI